jgi:hypothetical protein
MPPKKHPKTPPPAPPKGTVLPAPAKPEPLDAGPGSESSEQVQFIGPDELREILEASEKNRERREAAELRNIELSGQIEALNNKLKAQRPVRFDEQKVSAASDAVFAAALMDLKGALLPLSLTSTEAAKALVRIQKLEASLGSAIQAGTTLIQRAKMLAERKQTGLEVTPEDFEDLLAQAMRLL